MSRYLIDTNILSEPLKPYPHPNVVEKMQRFTLDIAIASITWHEIRYGCERLPMSRRRNAIETFLQSARVSFPILPYDSIAAAWHASERVRLKHRPPAFQDGQIAAIAATNQLIVVTNNVSDFRDFQGVQIENWFDEL
ncbi:MAG: type II toxin-antitoxin system VapC family toxin [Cyanobacteria bacterium J06639_1]